MFVLVGCQLGSVKSPALKFHYIYDPHFYPTNWLFIYIKISWFLNQAILFFHVFLYTSYGLICLENLT
ncbi:hypothetical protein BDV41DRAFT_533261 [Aspergillus transmontanensis]|uniref:Uncharacterized protein n=1 Tax=Aspergillus transmontanensis TaxID=1034304 RepID=A0A5N6W140_9EURO|nr:hypothetical protein BDV41DRAFT_533261 [Aspergillus transmontanensis]